MEVNFDGVIAETAKRVPGHLIITLSPLCLSWIHLFAKATMRSVETLVHFNIFIP